MNSQSVEIGPAKQLEPLNTDKLYSSYDESQDHDDNCKLLHLNDASVLDNLKTRYSKDIIYTYVAHILIALNPYKEIHDVYSEQTIKKYKGRSLGELPPHVFAIADKAIRDMRVQEMSQSIVVSGESGAGKTESTKHLLKYLCHSVTAAVEPIDQKILDANPILEAFGNAKTTRNNNSSRFVKFVEVHYNSECQVIGGHVSHFLLEKSRICTQSPEERNYHVFFMLCAGAPNELREKLGLGKPDDYQYLAGCTQYFATASTDQHISANSNSKMHLSKQPLTDPSLDDYENFHQLDQALSRIGYNDSTKHELYALVAAVLHLGNIKFEENLEEKHGGCQVSVSSEKALSMASKLIGIDSLKLRQALVTRAIQTEGFGFKSTVIMVPLKIHEASNARNALAKALYSRLFHLIVSNLNHTIRSSSPTYHIGVLDIAGFEHFSVNSFEQFCINYCNEKLQNFFNDKILKHEQELYRREGLNVTEIKFSDNQDIIELIESNPSGIFAILDEESKLPKPSFNHFTSEVHKTWSGHSRLSTPRASCLKFDRTLRDEEGFLVRHFAGRVCYSTIQFVEKNNDALHGSLEALLQESANSLLKIICATNSSMPLRRKLAFNSVGSKFKVELGELFKKLELNGTNFICCIKPNNNMLQRVFEDSLVLTQLKCLGIISAIELMEYGYPSRVPFGELHNMYKAILSPELMKLQPKTFCEAILHSLRLNNEDFKFGITKIFFRPSKFVEFDRIIKCDMVNLNTIVANVKKWILQSRWKKIIFTAICVIRIRNRIKYRNRYVQIIQKNVRGFMARKQHQPRYRGIAKIKAAKVNLKGIATIAQELKSCKDIVLEQVKVVGHLIDDSIRKIKSNVNILPNEIDKIYVDIVANIDSNNILLQSELEKHRQVEKQGLSPEVPNLQSDALDWEMLIDEHRIKSVEGTKKNTNKSQCLRKRRLCALEVEPVKRLQLDENCSTNSTRFDQSGHFPVLNRDGYPVRCKMEGCHYKTFASCSKCEVHLCLVQGRNCFIKFHVVENDSLQIEKRCLGFKHGTEKRPTDLIRFDQSGHFPVLDRNAYSVRCKEEDCQYKTFVSCLKCKVHLCLIKDRNCFMKFHHTQKKNE